MNVPKDLLYTKSHEWVELMDGGKARIGITDHAQEALGDLVYVELPDVGDSFESGGALAVVESVKATSDLYAPVGGTVSAVNEALVQAPELVNQDAYGTWIVELENVKKTDLLTPEAYEQALAEEE